MSDAPIAPTEVIRIPSTEGVVAVVGKQPVPILLDLNGDGIPDYQQRWFRDAVSGAAFKLLGAVFPKSPWAMALRQLEPGIQSIINTGVK